MGLAAERAVARWRLPDAARIARFGIVGVTGTATTYVLLEIMVRGLGIPVLTATSVAFVLVSLEMYLLHRSWTFRSSRPHHVALPQFLGMNVIGFCLNWATMFAGVQWYRFNYLAVQAAALAVVVAWNFSVTQFLIFRAE